MDAGIGFIWYKREEYDAQRAAFDDKEDLCESYDEWLSGARKQQRMFERQGITFVRVPMQLESFRAWCSKNGLAMNAEARSRWAAERAPQIAKRKGL